MAYRQFEQAAPGKSIWAIPGTRLDLTYIKRASVIFRTPDELEKLLQSEACAAVVFHSIIDPYLPLLANVPPEKTVIWIGWGFDYYLRLLGHEYEKGLLLDQTESLMMMKTRTKSEIAGMIARTVRNLVGRFLGNTVSFSPHILNRVDYFCPVLEPEYRMAVAQNPWFRARFITWNYGTAEDDMIVPETAGTPLGKDILVGNSATPENNHLEAFAIIKDKIDCSDKKIVVPLSYGDEWYRDRIVEAGYRFFGDLFVPLVDFVENTAYIKLLNSCGFVFMNHLRQQALGNICIMMLMGARIFMNDCSVLYQWLIEKGAAISSFDKVMNARNAPYSLDPLNLEERRVNADIIRSHWGRDTQRRKTQILVRAALEGN